MLKKFTVALVGCMLAAQTVFAAMPLAIVTKDGSKGCIDPEGKVVIPLAYKNILLGDKHTEDMVLVQQGKVYGLFNREGKELLSPQLEKIAPLGENIFGGKNQGTWSFYNQRGQKLFGEYEEVGTFVNGLAPVKKNKLWGFVDKTGKLVVDYQYKEVHNFSDGLAAVKRTNYWNYIDTTGKEIGLANIKRPGDFSEGLAVVDGSWLMDKEGQRLTKIRNYNYIGQFGENGLAPVGVRYRTSSFLDYLSIGWGFGGGWGWGVDGGGWGIGGYSSSYRHHRHDDGWGGFLFLSPGLFMPKNMKRGYINQAGREIIPTSYDYVSEFVGDYALIRSGGRWGMVDSTGAVAIAPGYDKLTPFSEGLAAFEFDNKWGYINEENKIAITNRFDRAEAFMGGFASVVEQGKGGVIDNKGEFVFKPLAKYKDIGPMQAGLAPFKEKDKWGYVGVEGTVVVKPEYDKAEIFR